MNLYELLVPWCRLHPGTDAERLALLQAKTITQVYSRFASFRTLASVLTPEEYATVRATLEAAANASVLVEDSLSMLTLPGDELGNGGGVDIGNASVRALCDSLFSAPVAAKIKAVAERQISQLEAWGVDVQPGHLASAREME